jgi:uncharacterized protein (TIGR03118 family)
MSQKIGRMIVHSLVSGIAICLLSATAIANTANSNVSQTNLVSDVPGLAAFTDPDLVNPWGISFSATSPFWVSDAGSNFTTVYSATGSTSHAAVTVPGSPTGTVQNAAGAGNFLVLGSAASFIFDTQAGTIYGWNTPAGTSAQLEAAVAGASFTGLALAKNGSVYDLYAANNAGAGGIVVFNSSWAQVSLAGSFTDPLLPAGYAPYNIQLINGQLYVEYDNPSSQRTPGVGAVAVFDLNGNFITQLIGPGDNLEAPWGIVVAPAGFYGFGGDLLVGNFGNGEIDAFTLATGTFIGTLDGNNGQPVVNQDLWALETRTGGTFNPNAVYFDAGIDHQTEGLFGELTASPAPEPGSWVTAASGCLMLILLLAGRRFRKAVARS